MIFRAEGDYEVHASSNLNFKTYYHNMYEVLSYESTSGSTTYCNGVHVQLYTLHTRTYCTEIRKYGTKYGSISGSTCTFEGTFVRKYNYTCTRTCTRVALSISKILNFRYTLLASPRERGRRRQSEMNCAKHRTASIDAKKTGDKCSYAATTRC